MAMNKILPYNMLMFVDIYQQFFILAGIMLFLLYVLNHVSRQKRFRYMRFLKRQKNLRFQKINELAKYPCPIPDDLSAQEMAGILILISGKKSVGQSVAAAIQFSDTSGRHLFDEDFFSYLFATAKRFQNAIWIKEALELMNMGEMLAKHAQAAHWQGEFQAQIQTLRYYRTGNATTYASDRANLKR